MAKRAEGVTEKLLECAREEFLQNGYENASLRVIAEKAGSSKGVIYIRYPDKESLYRALVQPVADGLCELLDFMLNGFSGMSDEAQRQQINSYSDGGFPKMIDYIYSHFDEFKLLLTSGENQTAQEFMHRLVELDTNCTFRFIEQTGNDALTSGRLTPELAHLLSSAFYSGLFEVVIHDMPKEQAIEHIQRMRMFYNASWQKILDGSGGDGN